jgi:dTDP-4-amino-4,6-dideoxy-D-galactose acyltransferase
MKREDIKIRYHQFSVDRNVPRDYILNSLEEQLGHSKSYISESGAKFYYLKNQWESDFFNEVCLTLIFIDFLEFDKEVLFESLQEYLGYCKKNYGGFQLTFEVPSEDIQLIQLLNTLSFRLIETRLHFVNNRLEDFADEKFNVRFGLLSDCENLKKIASTMRNDFDRFHADWNFSNIKADKYLEVYIENSLNGFCDVVLVPDDFGLASDSFLTANILKDEWEKTKYPISKMVLAAVSAETNRGWYRKLISEMTKYLISQGAKSIFMNTQSTNIAGMVTWQKLGYRIGRATHILSFKGNS